MWNRWGNKILQSSTAKNGVTEDGKIGYIFSSFRGFLTYYNLDFVPDFVTIKTINSVALEGRWGSIWELRSERDITLHKICILYLQPQQETVQI